MGRAQGLYALRSPCPHLQCWRGKKAGALSGKQTVHVLHRPCALPGTLGRMSLTKQLHNTGDNNQQWGTHQPLLRYLASVLVTMPRGRMPRYSWQRSANPPAGHCTASSEEKASHKCARGSSCGASPRTRLTPNIPGSSTDGS